MKASVQTKKLQKIFEAGKLTEKNYSIASAKAAMSKDPKYK